MFSQRLLHKMTIHVQFSQLAFTPVECQNFASILTDKYDELICRNVSCAQRKRSLHSRWNSISTLTLSYTAMATDADQWKWRQIHIFAVSQISLRCIRTNRFSSDPAQTADTWTRRKWLKSAQWAWVCDGSLFLCTPASSPQPLASFSRAFLWNTALRTRMRRPYLAPLRNVDDAPHRVRVTDVLLYDLPSLGIIHPVNGGGFARVTWPHSNNCYYAAILRAKWREQEYFLPYKLLHSRYHTSIELVNAQGRHSALGTQHQLTSHAVSTLQPARHNVVRPVLYSIDLCNDTLRIDTCLNT